MKARSFKLAATAFPLAALLASGCSQKKHEPAAPENLPAAPVRVQTVESVKRLAVEEVVGTVRPKLSAAIAAKVSGTILQMLAAPGQSVKAGQLLVQIDAREIQARLDQAQALREQTQKDLDRFKKLLAENILTQQEFDAAQSRSRVADATAREAETMLAYTKIIAPFDGIITAKRADVGDLTTPGKPLLELEAPAALRLEAGVPEALIDKIKLNDKLAVRVPTANLSLDATVSEISPVADPVSRTFLVKLDLPPTPGLRSGQFGRVAVPVAEVSAIRVPAAAVVVRGQMEIVFVVVTQRAQLRLVKTGKHLGSEIEIVSGLSAGEAIVVEGAGQLLDGQPVEVKK